MHNINLQYLEDELENTGNLLRLLRSKNSDPHHLDIIESQLDLTQNKFDHIMLHKTRAKRGLINGLGTAISWLTGNMDATDKEKYDEILRKVESNDYHLQHNVEQQLSINKNLIKEFNHDIQTVQDNTFKIRSYFKLLSNSTANLELNQNYLLLFNTLQILYNKISGIETSLEFCKLNMLHSSILSYREIKRIAQDSKVSLISDQPEILWHLTKVHCSLHSTFISYFLQIPLSSPQYETFFLLSYPISIKHEVATVNVNPSLIIRYNDILSGDCTLLQENYYCNKTKHVTNKCTYEILGHRNLDNCKHLVITPTKPFVKYIPIINQYLVYNISKLSLVSNNQSKIIYPKLISLLYLEQSEYLVNFSKPYIYWESSISLVKNLPPIKTYSNFSFEQIHRANINIQPLVPIEDISQTNNVIIYTVVTSFTLLSLVSIYIAYHCNCSSWHSRRTPSSEPSPSQASDFTEEAKPEEARRLHSYPSLPL